MERDWIDLPQANWHRIVNVRGKSSVDVYFRVMDKDQVTRLALLPGRDVLLGKFVGGLKSPVQKLHSVLSSPLRSLAAVLKQVSEQKA